MTLHQLLVVVAIGAVSGVVGTVMGRLIFNWWIKRWP